MSVPSSTPASGLRLASFPTPILSGILDRLPALNLYQLIYLTGCSHLKARACRGGVTSISLGRMVLSRVDLKFLTDFQGLIRVSIDFFRCDPSLEVLSKLPPTLLYLQISGPCSYWLNTPVSRDFAEHPNNLGFCFEGRSAFNFKRQFPVLEHLMLNCCPIPNRTCTAMGEKRIRMALLVSCLLPNTLVSMEASHLDHAIPSPWPSFEHLKILAYDTSPLEDAFPSNLSKAVSSHASDFALSQISIFIEAEQDPIILPSKTQYAIVRLKGFIARPSEPYVPRFLGCFSPTRVSPYDPSGSDTPTYDRATDKIDASCAEIHTRPLLRQLFLQVGNFFASSPTLSSWQWPASLQEVTIHSPNLFGDYSVFPRNLRLLRVTGTLTSANVLTLPPRLTALFLTAPATLGMQNAYTTAKDLTQLPESLVTAGFTDSLVTQYVGSLPRGLTSLNLDVEQYKGHVPAQFWSNLPPRLTSLYCSGQLIDTYLALVPKSIAYASFGAVVLTGKYCQNSPYYAQATKLYFPGNLPGTRLEDGTFLFDDRTPGEITDPYLNKTVVPAVSGPALGSWSDDMQLRREQWVPSQIRYSGFETLPVSLTDLRIDMARQFLANPQPILDLPNLTQLQIADFKAYPSGSPLPALTHLILNNQVDVLYTNGLDKFPASLTRLSFEMHQQRQHPHFIPDALAPQLLELKFGGYSTALPDTLKSLQMLSCNQYSMLDVVKVVSTWPKTVTSLRLESLQRLVALYNVGSLMRELPHLRSLDLGTGWEVSEHDLMEMAKLSYTSLECCFLVLHSLEEYTTLIQEAISEGSAKFNLIAAQAVQRKFPFLKLDKKIPVLRHTQEVTRLILTRMLEPLLENTLTSLTIGEGVTLWPKFGLCLPKSLLALNVIGASGVNSGSPKRPPSSLTELHIDATKVIWPGYKELPRGIKTLVLKNGRFTHNHARSLPPQLHSLTLQGYSLKVSAMENLPETIEILKLTQFEEEGLLYRGLPPLLTELHCGFSELPRFKDMPNTITRYIGGFYTTRRKMDQIVSLTPERMKETMESVYLPS